MLLSPTAWKFARALVLLIVSVSYLAYVFRFSEWLPRTRGLGDWQDPYFINALLEHWYRSAASFTDPSSPPMYFPAQKTLAYSHGLILYAPFYSALRLFVRSMRSTRCLFRSRTESRGSTDTARGFRIPGTFPIRRSPRTRTLWRDGSTRTG